MRARARQMGGDAIVGFTVGGRVDRSTSVSLDRAGVRFGSDEDSRNIVSGTVVRYREGRCDDVR